MPSSSESRSALELSEACAIRLDQENVSEGSAGGREDGNGPVSEGTTSVSENGLEIPSSGSTASLSALGKIDRFPQSPEKSARQQVVRTPSLLVF